MRDRIILVVVIVLAFIVWRGVTTAMSKNFNCEYKLVYAVCKAKSGSPKLPSTWEVLTAGVKF